MCNRDFWRKYKSENSFTIIELLITILIIAVIAVAVSLSISTGLKSVSRNRERSKANALATRLVENIRGMKYFDVGLTDATTGEPTGTLNRNTQIDGFDVNYQIVWVDNPDDGLSTADGDGDVNDYKLVTLSVTNSKMAKVTDVQTIIYPYSNDSFITKQPSVVITAPASGVPISGTIGVTVNVSDLEYEIASIELFINNIAVPGTRYVPTIPPDTSLNNVTHTYNIDTTAYEDGVYTLEAISYNDTGGEGLYRIYLVVNNEGTLDTKPPSDPTGLSGVASKVSGKWKVVLNWSASTDNYDGTTGSGVQYYFIYRNEIYLNKVSGSMLTFTDTGVAKRSTYTYYVTAVDYKNNSSDQIPGWTPNRITITTGN